MGCGLGAADARHGAPKQGLDLGQWQAFWCKHTGIRDGWHRWAPWGEDHWEEENSFWCKTEVALTSDCGPTENHDGVVDLTTDISDSDDDMPPNDAAPDDAQLVRLRPRSLESPHDGRKRAPITLIHGIPPDGRKWTTARLDGRPSLYCHSFLRKMKNSCLLLVHLMTVQHNPV